MQQSIRWIPILLLAVALRAEGSIPFTDVAEQAGVADAGRTNGAAFGDYDGDGWPDLVVGHLESGESAKLYRNQRNGTFTDVSDLISFVDDGAGGTFVDIDTDGDLDIYLTSFIGSERLLINDEGVYSLLEPPSSVASHKVATGAAFGDFDGDRGVDFFRGQVSRMLSNGIGDGSPRAVQAAQVSMRLCG